MARLWSTWTSLVESRSAYYQQLGISGARRESSRRRAARLTNVHAVEERGRLVKRHDEWGGSWWDDLDDDRGTIMGLGLLALVTCGVGASTLVAGGSEAQVRQQTTTTTTYPAESSGRELHAAHRRGSELLCIERDGRRVGPVDSAVQPPSTHSTGRSRNRRTTPPSSSTEVVNASRRPRSPTSSPRPIRVPFRLQSTSSTRGTRARSSRSMARSACRTRGRPTTPPCISLRASRAS